MWWKMWSRIRTVAQRLARRRSTRLTSEGVRFILLTLAIGVAAINTGNNLFYLLLAMMLSVIMMSGIVAEHCVRRLEFHLYMPDLLFAKEPVTATLVVVNRKSRLPSFSLRLFDVIDKREIDRGLVVRHLLPGARHILSYPFVAAKRGRLSLGSVRVVTPFPFGLLVKKASYPVQGTAVVCPEITPIGDELLQEVVAIGYERSLHRRGQGHDLYNLRPYQTGDDSRNIHWLTTAKTSKLIIRETEVEDQRRVTLILPTVAPASHDALFEQAVSVTASLAYHLSRRGYQIRLMVGTTCSPFGQGDIHLVSLLQTLALCERCPPDADSLDVFDAALPQWEDDRAGAVIAMLPWDGPNIRATLGDPDLVIDEPLLRGTGDAV
jgi:uncharacterized protein (DUF58 family)